MARIKKAANPQKNNVIKINENKYNVKSQSDEKKIFRVQSFSDNIFKCNCEDFLDRFNKLPHNECTHIMGVKLYIKLPRKELDEN